MNRILEFMGINEEQEKLEDLTPQQLVIEKFRLVKGDYALRHRLYVCVDDLLEFFDEYKIEKR